MSDLQSVPPRDIWTHRAEHLMAYRKERKLSDAEFIKELERALRDARDQGRKEGAEDVRAGIRDILQVKPNWED
jgi:hypothetical protein